MNKKIIEVLQKLEILREINDEQYSALAFKKVIKNLEGLDYEIVSKKDLENVSGVGVKIKKYIEDVLKNKEIPELLEEKDKIDSIYNMMSLHGIGFRKALKIYLSGEKTVEGYEKKKRIPREIVKKFEKDFKEIIKKYDIKYKITGSYRRKLKDVGDIDIILYDENKNLKKIMDKIIKKLNIVKTLSHGDIKFQGTIYLNKEYPEERIDITIIQDIKSIPYALLHTTGNVNLNIHMRKEAIKKGWRLNDTKMTDENGKNIEVNSEKQIFELLDMKYLKPKYRNY
uniref:DNA-directed DNA polymerase X domain-containing protein n=1 Tax=viral metagenome TaxID=1070528 RepID=A0A6C0ADS9_9ZZZZ